MAVFCPDHRLLFICNPRTGSSAISQTLLSELGGQWLPEENIRNNGGRIEVSKKHCTLPQLLKHGLIDEEALKDVTVFTTIRNPYDSLHSKYIKKCTKHKVNLNSSSFKKKKWWRVEEIQYCQDHGFNSWIFKYYGKPYLKRHLVRSPTARYANGADIVIRFDRLQEDFQKVLQRARVEKEIVIPMRNKTKAKRHHYREEYNPLSRLIVYLSFKPEFDRYDFRF